MTSTTTPKQEFKKFYGLYRRAEKAGRAIMNHLYHRDENAPKGEFARLLKDNHDASSAFLAAKRRRDYSEEAFYAWSYSDDSATSRFWAVRQWRMSKHGESRVD